MSHFSLAFYLINKTMGSVRIADFGKAINGKGKIFVQISGTGTINEMSVMDYSGASPKEFKSTQTEVAMGTSANVGVAVDLATSVKENPSSVNSAKTVLIKKVGNAYSMILPTQESYNITIRSVSGKLLDQFSSNRKAQVTFGSDLPSGMHVVSIASSSGVIKEKLNVIR
jgi:hypothetical protein